MNTNPSDPNFLPTKADDSVPDALTLLSLVREDLNNAVESALSRADEHAKVIVSSVANGVFIAGIALSKSGEYRFIDLELNTVIQMWQLKEQQYNPEKGGWLSVVFTVENDGFITKTEYNYDKPVFLAPTPEEWYIAPETPSEEHHSVWTLEQYQTDLEKFPRNSGTPEWMN